MFFKRVISFETQINVRKRKYVENKKNTKKRTKIKKTKKNA